MTINNMFERVTTKGKDLVSQNPFKDTPPLKDFQDLPAVEKQAQVQLQIIKEFIENFQTFQKAINTPTETVSGVVSQQTVDIPIDKIIANIKDEEDKNEFLQYKTGKGHLPK